MGIKIRIEIVFVGFIMVGIDTMVLAEVRIMADIVISGRKCLDQNQPAVVHYKIELVGSIHCLSRVQIAYLLFASDQLVQLIVKQFQCGKMHLILNPLEHKSFLRCS